MITGLTKVILSEVENKSERLLSSGNPGRIWFKAEGIQFSTDRSARTFTVTLVEWVQTLQPIMHGGVMEFRG